jgi:hypothetical protein
VLHQPDHRQDEQEDAHRPAPGEAGAEGVEHLERGHPTEEARHQPGDGHDQHGVEPQREADDHHQDSEQHEHAPLLPLRKGAGVAPLIT